MTDSGELKPPTARDKPKPARELVGDPPPISTEVDAPEARFVVEGKAWTVRVLGRSGRASGASPPLLLLGFWDGQEEGEEPLLEALVVGRELTELSEEVLETALSGAKKRPDPDRRPAFFPDAGQGPRGRSKDF